MTAIEFARLQNIGTPTCCQDYHLEVPLASKYDTLYHVQINHLPIHADTIRKETKNDPELKTVLDCLESGKWTTDDRANLRMYYMKRNNFLLKMVS